jgi:hypothetical protein
MSVKAILSAHNLYVAVAEEVMLKLRQHTIHNKLIAFLVIGVLLLGDTWSLFKWWPESAEAALVAIDTVASGNQNKQNIAGNATVFTADQVGYKFYVDADGTCVYSKTSDGGVNWASPVVVDSQTDCATPTVWYDQWTPGETGNYIYIVTQDPGEDDLWFNRLDVSSDTLLLGANPVNVTSGLGYAGTLAAGTNKPAITKGTDGTVYVVVGDGSDSIIAECTSNCNLSVNWSETEVGGLDSNNDVVLMMPQPSGDIMLLRRDRNLDDLQYQIWDNSSWSGWSNIDGDAPENGTFDVLTAATVDDDFNVYVAYIAATDFVTADHDLRIAYYDHGADTWTTKPDIITDDTRGLTTVAIALDANTNDVYVAYSARTNIGITSSANVYYVSSNQAMTSWSAEQGPVNAVSDNIYGVDLNFRSLQRIFVSWYEDGTRDVNGDTIANVSPKTVVSATGTQVSVVRASSSAAHIGGAFVFREFDAARTVGSITLTELGTIDGATGVGDIALYYDLDTSAPYDCASESYGGEESQYGSTDSNGFSGADGVAVFTDIVSISPTRSLCVYPVIEVLKSADDGATVEIVIADPVTDIALSGGVTAVPEIEIALAGTTNVEDDDVTQTHFHFRNDDGLEGAATSRTGGVQDISLGALQLEESVRLRFGVSNEGSTSSFPTALRLEYAPINGTCAAVTSWTDIDAVDDAWNLSPTGFITDGLDATDIAEGIGGVANENSSFITANGGLRDIDSTLSPFTFTPTNWLEAEFSIVASTSAAEGETYCFRLSDEGQAISSYDVYPQVTISADVTVTATGSPVATADIPSTGKYIGGAFVIAENAASRNVTSITLTEVGTVDAANGLDNIALFYDLDTSFPYNCASESYGGIESQFGTTDTDGFSAANGIAVFTDSVGISTTATLCVYPVMDIATSAQNGETVDVVIMSGQSDVVVDGGGSVSPATTLDSTGSTTLTGGILSQTHYHWRQDDGDEIAASSYVSTEDTVLGEVMSGERVRLRLGVDNLGGTTSVPTALQLEYGVKLTTCENVAVWTDVGAVDDAWNMYDSTFLANGANTSNISTTSGGVSDPDGASFLSVNGGVRDTESATDAIVLGSAEFTELEFSITSTITTSEETEYCFRVTNAGTPLPQYDVYPELETAPRRDFRVQRGTSVVTGASLTLTAGADYVAPGADAFVRITNMHHTGAGRTVSDNIQEADDVTVYVSDATDLATSFTLARNSSNNDTVVSWEILEFVGEVSTDNEMIVHTRSTVNLNTGVTAATGTSIGGVSDNSDVVVFITGIANADVTANAYFNGQVTSRWDALTNEPVFERGAATADVQVSYAVVEFTGQNWKVQRAEHSYTAAGVTETESISPVGSLSRTFLHSQKRMGSHGNEVHFGHEVWLSSIGAASFRLSPYANIGGQVSVAWIIENTQTSAGAMNVQRRSGSILGGVEPRTTAINFVTPIGAMNNASVFAMSAFEYDLNNYPRVLGGVTIVSTTTFEIYNSDIRTGTPYYYRAEIIEWPVSGLAVRQNYYRFYHNNDALNPTDAWPPGPIDLGENTTITALDEPVAEGDELRLRISAAVSNATLPAGLRSFKLQYGQRVSSCSSVNAWNDVGAIGGGEIWRYIDTGATDGIALSSQPPSVGDLNLSVSDVAGRLVESSPSVANPYDVNEGEDVEYDFAIEHNGAAGSTFYCFRMVADDGTPLDGYNYYPQLRTAGFTPIVNRWRWYDDADSDPPSTPLAVEQSAPSGVAGENVILLRVSIDEIKHVAGNNVNLKLQYSEYADFSVVSDMTPTSTCTENSLWCYADVIKADRSLISSAVVSGVDACVVGVGDGCGLHIESDEIVLGDVHEADANREYAFAIKQAGARANAVYYFRVYDVTNSEPIIASTTYPSLVAEPTELTSILTSVASGTVVAGVEADVDTTPTSIAFGSIPTGNTYEAIHRLTITTNATEGYQLLMYAGGQLTNQYGDVIEPITATNNAPAGWNTACNGVTSCFGYHTTDATLRGGSTRFAPEDSYAALSVAPQEIMYSSVPTSDTHDIIYRISVPDDQPAGDYETNIMYISVPVF